jgi:hypothetical protein
MWAGLQSEILSRLPRHGSNGATHNRIVTVPTTSPGRQEWDKCMKDLEGISAYHNDWDGQGAEAPSSEIMDSAVNLAKLLHQQGIDPPSCVVPGVNGTVVFEWQGENGAYLEIEITAPDRADGCLIVPGKLTEHWTLK